MSHTRPNKSLTILTSVPTLRCSFVGSSLKCKWIIIMSIWNSLLYMQMHMFVKLSYLLIYYLESNVSVTPLTDLFVGKIPLKSVNYIVETEFMMISLVKGGRYLMDTFLRLKWLADDVCTILHRRKCILRICKGCKLNGICNFLHNY